jgi:hypothetical protein
VPVLVISPVLPAPPWAVAEVPEPLFPPHEAPAAAAPIASAQPSPTRVNHLDFDMAVTSSP